MDDRGVDDRGVDDRGADDRGADDRGLDVGGVDRDRRGVDRDLRGVDRDLRGVARDRDGSGRARNGRPRDALGRPLPRGAVGQARAPEGAVRAPADTLAEAQRLLDAGRPFHAHEVLEDAWKSAPEPDRRLWRGLAQVAVGLTHAARGNRTGAVALLARGAGHLTAVGGSPYGVDVAGVASWAQDLAAAAATEGDLDLAPPSLRLP